MRGAWLPWFFLTSVISCVGTCLAGIEAQRLAPAPVSAERRGSFEVAVVNPRDGGAALVALKDLDAFFATNPDHALELRAEDQPRVKALLAKDHGTFDGPHVTVEALPGGGQKVEFAGQSFDDSPQWSRSYIAKGDQAEPLEQRAVYGIPTSAFAYGLPYCPLVFVLTGAVVWLGRKVRITRRQ